MRRTKSHLLKILASNTKGGLLKRNIHEIQQNNKPPRFCPKGFSMFDLENDPQNPPNSFRSCFFVQITTFFTFKYYFYVPPFKQVARYIVMQRNKSV